MSEEGIYEIKIKKVSELSPVAQQEVLGKLEELPETFNYRGYAKIVYGASPFRVIGVDPIQGNILDYFNDIINSLVVDKSVICGVRGASRKA